MAVNSERSLESDFAIVTGAGAGLIAGDTREHWHTIDVREWEQVEGLVTDVVDQFGRLDILINNAGVSAAQGASVDLDLGNWHDVIDTNLDGTWFGYRAAIRQMLRQPTGGRIVNVPSRLALSAGGPGRRRTGRRRPR